MTDDKKKEKGKSGAKAKKLQLNKETIKDLNLRKGAGGDPKGAANPACTGAMSGCAGG